MSSFKKVTDKEVIPMTVAAVMNWLQHETINLNPSYQRDPVWKKEQKVYLIDSIIRDYDLPKLYFLKVNDDKYDVVDGQQRVRTLSEFLDDEFSLSASDYNGEYAGKKFSQLPPKVKNLINEFELHIVELNGDRWTDEVIRDVFQRLQKGTPLNPAEKRHALTGNIRLVVEDLSSSNLFSKCSQLSSSRFGYEDAAAKILHLILDGEKNGLKAASIAKTYKNYRDLSLTDSRVQELKKAMNFLSKALDGNPYFKKYSVISVTTAMVELMKNLSFVGKHEEVAAMLIKIEEDRLNNDKLSSQDPNYNVELSKLTSAARSDRVDHLKWRKTFYINRLKALGLSSKDPVRLFKHTDRSILLQKQNNACAICKSSITAKNSQVDHIHPHSLGGITEIENAQLLCVKCNRSKGKKLVQF